MTLLAQVKSLPSSLRLKPGNNGAVSEASELPAEIASLLEFCPAAAEIFAALPDQDRHSQSQSSIGSDIQIPVSLKPNSQTRHD